MKLSHLLNSARISEETQEEHSLMSKLLAAAKEIPDSIDNDFENACPEYPKDFFMNHKNGLFNNTGKCLADQTDILNYAENEKVRLLVAGYDGMGYEELFICTKSPEMLVKKSATPGNFAITFRGSRFDMPAKELQSVLDSFSDTCVAKYDRIHERKERDEGFDEDTPRWAIRQHQNRWRNGDDGYEPELDEDDFTFTDVSLYGAFVYQDLHHD